MHLKYKINLPDHQYVVAASQKLKPSVYALCAIKPRIVGSPDAVVCNSPTAFRVRFCKLDKSSRAIHWADLMNLQKGVDCGDD